MPVTYETHISPRIINICNEVIKSYPELDNLDIHVRRKDLGGSTMRAIPSIVWKPVPSLRYNIDISTTVRDSDNLMVADLPDLVLEGWLAHEVGHILDYRDKNFFEMIIYGIRYSLSDAFARRVEHRADELAVQHGFYASVKATKMFLSQFDQQTSGYGRKLLNNYMSLEDLEICNREWLKIELINDSSSE